MHQHDILDAAALRALARAAPIGLTALDIGRNAALELPQQQRRALGEAGRERLGREIGERLAAQGKCEATAYLFRLPHL